MSQKNKRRSLLVYLSGTMGRWGGVGCLAVVLSLLVFMVPGARGDGSGIADCSSLPEPGAPRQWESAIPVSTYCTANAINRNMHCEIPIIGWQGVGPDISISLYHNSASVFSPFNVSDDAGRGWKVSYAAQVMIVPSLTVDGLPGDYIYIEDDGTRHRFRGVVDPNNSSNIDFVHPPGMFSSLVAEDFNNVRITHKDGSYHLFDGTGRLKEIADAQGNKVMVTHSSFVLPYSYQKTITDTTGRVAKLQYMKVGRDDRLARIEISAVDGPDPEDDVAVREWLISYNSHPTLPNTTIMTITDPESNVIDTQLRFGGFITEMVDKRDTSDEPEHKYVFTYDATYRDRLANVADPEPSVGAGSQTSQTFSTVCSGNKITTTYTDRRNAAWTFRSVGLIIIGILPTFDESNGPIERITDPLGGLQLFSYNSERQLTEYTDERAHIWSYTYDANGNLLTANDPLLFGSGQTWTYDVNNNVTSYTDAENNTVTYEYNVPGQPQLLSKIIEPPAETGGLTAETVFTYYTEGKMCYFDDDLLSTNGSWSSTACTTSFDCTGLGNDSVCGTRLGLIDTITDPNGVVTKMDYDGWGQIHNYGEGYDATDEWAVYAIRTVYDGGSRMRTTTPLLNGPSGSFRAEEECIPIASGSSCSWTTTNAAKNCLCVLPQTSGQSCNTIMEPPPGLPPLPCNVEALPKPKAFNDSADGDIEYTGMDLLKKNFLRIEYPSDTHTTETPRREFTYTYDHLNQIATASIKTAEHKVGSTPSRTFSFIRDYALGTVEQTGPDGVVTRIETDLLGRVSLVRRGPAGAADLETSYTYLANGLVHTITYAGTTNVVATYSYLNNNRLSQIHYLSTIVGAGEIDLRLSYLYNPRGLPTAIIEYKNGSAAHWARTNYTYDARGRLTMEGRTDNPPYSFTYEYDPGGNRTKKIDLENFIEVTYYYDITETGALAGINNRLIYYSTDSTTGGTTTPISTTYYDYTNEGNPDRIITELANPATGEPRFAATRFGYAANGTAVAYILGETWNEDGSAGSPIDGCVDDFTVTYAREFRYDSGRQRYLNRELDPVAVQSGDMTVIIDSTWSDYAGDSVYSDYLADPSAPPGETYTELAMYQPGIGQVTGLDPLSTEESSYYVTNHLGTTLNRFDKNALPLAPATYSAFGERIDTGTYERYGYAGSWGYQQHNSFEFSGSLLQDDEPPDPPGSRHTAFQFSHVGARYYDPAQGRFMQRDPIGVVGGLNVYAYVRGSPLTSVDPSGLKGGTGKLKSGEFGYSLGCMVAWWLGQYCCQELPGAPKPPPNPRDLGDYPPPPPGTGLA